MKVASFFTAVWVALTTTAPGVADRWETLAPPPFPFGISAGGGIATDGTYLYAADLSGDGNQDFIDTNDNDQADDGEFLEDLGIPNASVRFARYDPVAGSWEPLPTLEAAGVPGDAFSAGNFNRPLFCAGGFLYYYQMRAGPQRCVLHRYDLAAAPGGGWQQVWDKSTTEAMIEPNAGMVGIDTSSGPVILHHAGGGAYRIVRTSEIGSGGAHVELTPEWPFTGAHFPRNGCWEYDPLSGRILHMSGDQLVGWSPSTAYPDAGFLTSTPVGGSPLAVFETSIESLKDELGWDPGGTSTRPGTSLWGNSLVVVNDPSGMAGGPSGQDTGSNVVYLVRGESSPDTWPFNEGRGQVGNGSFARWFRDSGEAQPLEPAPFHVGKGSDAVYLDGWIYLTQGETRNSPDDPGNVAPTNSDGIRRPGDGFARFRIRGEVYATGSPVIPVGDHLAGGFVSVTTSPLADGEPALLFDRDPGTSCTTDAVDPAVITLNFPGSIPVGAARAWIGPEAHTWTLDAADSADDLASGTGSFVHVFGPETVSGEEPCWGEWNDSPVLRRIFRFTIERAAGAPVEIRELELQYPKEVHVVDVGGVPTRVNHLELVPSSVYLLAGASETLAAELSLSLGPDRHDVAAEAAWSTGDPAVATVTAGVVDGLAVGTTPVTAEFGPFTAGGIARVVEVSDHDDDIAVAWIQRLPVLPFVWGSAQPATEGWPTAGSPVTWRARVRNWWPFPREDVGYRWLLDGTVVAAGTVDLAADGLTDVDLPWPWSFDRHRLRFEIDPDDAVPEFSEENNAVDTWTDAITVAFWVERSLFDHFHANQRHLGIGSNGWEDWAQRQVARWNAAFAAATHPVDAPAGVLDRIRLDKVTIVDDGALPLNGGLPTNNPDSSDRTTDLVWGFPASLLGGGMYSDHHSLSDSNAFFFEGSLIHELGHARYLIDVYGFNVVDRADNRRVLITDDGDYVAGTPLMPRTWMWWDHVFYVAGWSESGPFHGLMNSPYHVIDRYSTMALNRIAGHRATRGNYNAPGNIGEFLDDLPEQNTVQLVDGYGRPIAGATVGLYRATGAADWYGKQFDDTVDATFTSDANGCIEVGRNPFTDGGKIRHSYGISETVAVLRVDAGPRTGFAFLPAAWFQMEFWRGNTGHGHCRIEVAMLGNEPEIAHILAFPHGGGRRLRVIAGGSDQPESVVVDGVPAEFREGAWWVTSNTSGDASSEINANWPDGPTLTRSYFPGPPALPRVVATPLADGLRLGWQSDAGTLYRIEHSDQLGDWWPTAGQPDHFGTGGWLEADDLSPGRPRGFSRLRVFRLQD